MSVLQKAAMNVQLGLTLARRSLSRKRVELMADGAGLGLVAYAVGWVDGLRPSLGVGLAGVFLILLSWSTKGSGS